jgi:two-component system phosphate regulon sensor histidine kinase PhoR
MKKSDLAVEPLVDDILQTVSPTARKRSVVVMADVEKGLPRLYADPTRLRQILLNLTDNALKFSPEGSKVRIVARATSLRVGGDDEDGVALFRSTQPAVEFRVADEGIGIPEEERGKVFDAFYQVDSSSTRQVGGTGLGLSIVKRLVEGHGGRVHIEANQPRGAVFVVVIPCRRATLS